MASTVSLAQQGLYQAQTHLNIKSHDTAFLAVEKIIVGTITKVALTAIGLIETLFFGMLSLAALPLAAISPKHYSVLTKRTWSSLEGGLSSFNSVFAPFAKVTQLSHLTIKDRVIASLNARFSKFTQLINLNTNQKLAKLAEELITFGATIIVSQALLLITTNVVVEERNLALLATVFSIGAVFASASTDAFLSDSGLMVLKGTGLGVLVGLIGESSIKGGGALGALVGGIAGAFIPSIGVAVGSGFGGSLGSMGLSKGLIIGTAVGAVFTVKSFFNAPATERTKQVNRATSLMLGRRTPERTGYLARIKSTIWG